MVALLSADRGPPARSELMSGPEARGPMTTEFVVIRHFARRSLQRTMSGACYRFDFTRFDSRLIRGSPFPSIYLMAAATPRAAPAPWLGANASARRGCGARAVPRPPLPARA